MPYWWSKITRQDLLDGIDLLLNMRQLGDRTDTSRQAVFQRLKREGLYEQYRESKQKYRFLKNIKLAKFCLYCGKELPENCQSHKYCYDEKGYSECKRLAYNIKQNYKKIMQRATNKFSKQ